ncbi:pyridoxal phosphate-dependent transferase [Gorgonomyces haynaldii]|nr:pyridoxal phosphate-dependent transferase [Gorgonomyces haynaldii]
MYQSTKSSKIVADFRSDTVTKPTEQMLKQMLESAVGDDVFHEDPTVNALEERVAAMAGKEAGLFCASGTMTNQLAIRCHLQQPPYSVVIDHRAHVDQYEGCSIAFHTGARTISVKPKGRFLTGSEVEQALVLDDDVHHAPTKLVCLENTLGGAVMPLEDIKDIHAVVSKHGIPLHLDGARLWNAAAKTGIPLSEWCAPFDSISLCFSKGMGAPVGSVLVGSKALIKKARHFRKMYGGGWRQAGVLAGACHYSLDNIFPRMHLDHQRAQKLKEALEGLGFKVVGPVDTNMVWVDCAPYTATQVHNVLEPLGVKIFEGNNTLMRLVVHHQIEDAHIDLLVSGFKALAD